MALMAPLRQVCVSVSDSVSFAADRHASETSMSRQQHLVVDLCAQLPPNLRRPHPNRSQGRIRQELLQLTMHCDNDEELS